MLYQLSIRNVVLIESLDLEFEEGFSIFTGETGAGKSILLDALGLVLGERSDQSLIQKEKEQACVVAEFCNHFSLLELYEEHGLPIEQTLTLKRILQSNGRSKAFVNDMPVSLQVLKLFGSRLVDIHGQNDHLLEPHLQRNLLDQKIDPVLRGQSKKAYEKWIEAKKNLELFESTINQHIQQQAFLKMQREDLNNLKPQPSEEAILLERRSQIAGFAKIATTVEECLQAISYPKDLAQEIAQYQQILARANSIGLKALDEATQGLDRAYIEIKEAQNILQGLLENHQAHAQELGEIDQRLSDLRTIGKKYNTPCDELFRITKALEQSLKDLDDPENKRDILEKATETTKKEFSVVANEIHETRILLAQELESVVNRELPDLFLPHSKFKVKINILPEEYWSTHGWDQITFEVCMNPGQPFSPLHKTASGGEMARLMLALKVTGMHQESPLTIIFDEIDQGVSGAVALAIGKRLKRLGKFGQTMAISHSAQVASQANHHFIVKKHAQNNKTITTVQALSREERYEEIGRMLSGDVITDEAKAAAKALLGGTFG